MGRDCLWDSEEQHKEWNEMYILCFSPCCPRGSLFPYKARCRSAVQSFLCLAPRCPRGSLVPNKSEEHQFCGAVLAERTVCEIYRYTDVQMYRCTCVNVYRCTGVQVNRGTGVQVFRCTGVQVYRCTGTVYICTFVHCTCTRVHCTCQVWFTGNMWFRYTLQVYR